MRKKIFGNEKWREIWFRKFLAMNLDKKTNPQLLEILMKANAYFLGTDETKVIMEYGGVHRYTKNKAKFIQSFARSIERRHHREDCFNQDG